MAVEKFGEHDYEGLPRIRAWFLSGVDRPIRLSSPRPGTTEFRVETSASSSTQSQ